MKKNLNPWTENDEKEHYPSVIEWWCAEGFFESNKEKKYNFKGSFTEWFTKEKEIGSTIDFTLFDLDKKEHISFYKRSDKNKLITKYDKNKGQKIEYEKSYLQGRFPNYEMSFYNPKNDIKLNLSYNSKFYPHWITQDITGGYLPMGFGFYRYGFIPRLDIKGILKIKNKSYEVEGFGYYEHVWGDFSYKNPLGDLSFLKKSLKIYSKLTGWWIHNHKLKIPNKIKFSSENNPLGYDWVWAVFDNGWSIYLGNILFWVSEGPVFGTLVFTKDGERYTEFCDVSYKYKKLQKSKNFDFIYPSEIEVIAKKGNEKLSLNFKSTMDSREFVNPLNQKKWIAFVICESPGVVKGYYQNNNEKINLYGNCKLEPQRQISIYGHNVLSFEFLKPPKGVGIKIDFNSHHFKKRIKANLKLAPKPKIRFSVKKK